MRYKDQISRKRARRETEAFGRTIVFPLDLLEDLKPHADRRGIHVNRLARMIVEEVVDARIVDAVLDDIMPVRAAIAAAEGDRQ